METTQKPGAKPRNPNWGGPRKNAGRKKKYGEATMAVTIRVPISKVGLVRKTVKEILETTNLP